MEDDDENESQKTPAESSDQQDDGHEEEAEDVLDAATRLKRKFQHVKKFVFTRRSGKPCRIILSYNPSMAKLLLLPLIEKAVHTSTIQVIPGVGQCQLFMEEVRDADGKVLKQINAENGKEEDVKEPVITTEGVNLPVMRAYQDVIQPHSLYTNSVHDMLTYYGVEAARNTIIKEISTVFAGHGIAVDNRHINLIADAMTQSGMYKPFSRHGVVKESGSALAKMSFETVMGFLREAVLHGESDPLLGPSARIVAGRRGNIGTGSFDVVVGV
ncbi:dna-directed rna polymerase i subunit rpa1 [Lasallia pustulata]|uniref:DNA-directed RNA polymerase n=1 Tax=Lasallia pustulata TaxID=136370 RepID=A0A1W5D0M5_9LECA|nr:dna-directed rna polymerase i subunit rpa1 [Lasallia pustulata]